MRVQDKYKKKMKMQHNTMKGQKNVWRRVALMAIAVLVVSQPSWGQYRRRRGGLADGDHYHFAYVSGHVGYSILETHAKGVMPSGSAAGGFGIGYEYRNSGLWANVGLQMSFHRSSLKLDPYTEKRTGMYYGSTPILKEFPDDPKQELDVFNYNISQKDEIQWNFLDVPVLFGYYTHGFHIGAGVKLSYALSSKSHTSGTYSLTYKPSWAQTEPWENMPDRGLTDYSFDNNQDNRINVGASLIGEIGYDLLSSMPTNSRLCNVLKLSFYFEYGLNNYNKGGDKQRFVVLRDENQNANITDVVFNPFLNTEASPARTVPFFAGAKITYLIGGSRTARAGFHRGCMCYN